MLATIFINKTPSKCSLHLINLFKDLDDSQYVGVRITSTSSVIGVTSLSFPTGQSLWDLYSSDNLQ